jgi:hypothetical protein
MSITIEELAALKVTLSAQRILTYEQACGGIDDPCSADLYIWNAQISAALMVPLHICEVAIRNAAAAAIESKYGPNWPWNNTFVTSLPNPGIRYNPRADLIKVRNTETTTGKVIPELKFVFWEKLFTKRHDNRLWDPYLRMVFPSADAALPIKTTRLTIGQDLEAIRLLRNRIAHHEPIFTRNLIDDFSKICYLINLRCPITKDWMVNNQTVLDLISKKP